MTICVIHCGAQTPTGTNLPMSTASIMAGISRISKHETIEDKIFNPVSLGTARFLYEDLANLDRFIELAVPAFEEALRPLKKLKKVTGTLTVFLGLPKPRLGLDKEIENKLINELKIVDPGAALKVEFMSIREDHDSGMIALKQIEKQIADGVNEFFVIGGVDSFISEETVDWLEKKKLLKTSVNKGGFIPGEAASFCLVCSEKTAEKYELSILTKILGTEVLIEPCLPGSETPTTGIALSKAILKTLESLPDGQKISEVICTLKGLRNEADEFAYCGPAIGSYLKSTDEPTSLAHRWGDVGAASGPALISFVAEKRKLGFIKTVYNLIFTMSPDGSRSAALIKVE